MQLKELKPKQDFVFMPSKNLAKKKLKKNNATLNKKKKSQDKKGFFFQFKFQNFAKQPFFLQQEKPVKKRYRKSLDLEKPKNTVFSYKKLKGTLKKYSKSPLKTKSKKKTNYVLKVSVLSGHKQTAKKSKEKLKKKHSKVNIIKKRNTSKRKIKSENNSFVKRRKISVNTRLNMKALDVSKKLIDISTENNNDLNFQNLIQKNEISDTKKSFNRKNTLYFTDYKQKKINGENTFLQNLVFDLLKNNQNQIVDQEKLEELQKLQKIEDAIQAKKKVLIEEIEQEKKQKIQQNINKNKIKDLDCLLQYQNKETKTNYRLPQDKIKDRLNKQIQDSYKLQQNQQQMNGFTIISSDKSSQELDFNYTDNNKFVNTEFTFKNFSQLDTNIHKQVFHIKLNKGHNSRYKTQCNKNSPQHNQANFLQHIQYMNM